MDFQCLLCTLLLTFSDFPPRLVMWCRQTNKLYIATDRYGSATVSQLQALFKTPPTGYLRPLASHKEKQFCPQMNALKCKEHFERTLVRPVGRSVGLREVNERK